MKLRKTLALLLSLVMLVSLAVPAWATEGGNQDPQAETQYVAKIGEDANKQYKTLEEAFANANDDETITLLADCAGNGIKVSEGKFANGLTVDFDGHTYTMDGTAVGSTGTETSSFQLLKGNKVTFKNGIIAVANENTSFKRIFQSYADVTFSGMTINGENLYGDNAANEFCNGTVTIQNSTFTAKQNVAAINVDAWNGAYPDGAHVEVGEGSNISWIHCHTEGTGTAATSALAINGGVVSKLTVGEDSTVAVTKTNDVNVSAPEGYYWADETTLTEGEEPVEEKTPYEQAVELATTYVAEHYNKHSNGDKITPADDYYVKVEGNKGDYSFLQDGTFDLSVGNNAFIQGNYYVEKDDELYIAFPVILFEMAGEGQTLNFTSVKSQDESYFTVTDEGDGTYTMTHDKDKPATKYVGFGIDGVDYTGKLITKKAITYADKTTSVAYGISTVDPAEKVFSENNGIWYYVFGWDTTKVADKWNGATTEYSVYSVGQGKTGTLTIHQKLECAHTYGDPKWVWDLKDGKVSAKVTITCAKDGDSKTANAKEVTTSDEVNYHAVATIDGVNYEADYTKPVEYYTVTFDSPITSEDARKSFQYGEVCKLTFTGGSADWTVDGVQVASGKETYSFVVTKNVTVSASGTAQEEAPVFFANLSTVKDSNGQDVSGKTVFSGGWTIPKAVNIKSATIYCGRRAVPEAVAIDVIKAKGAKTDITRNITNYTFDFTLNNTSGKYQNVYFEVVYEDANGEVQTWNNDSTVFVCKVP